jgi:cytochrome c553
MWADIHFDHGQTQYPLDGQHVSVACARCHAPSAGSRALDLWQFQGAATTCAGCHGGVHR